MSTIKYTLDDGFEFVTDERGLIIATRLSGTDNYQDEKNFQIYVIGSVSTAKLKQLKIDSISNPPVTREHLVVKGEPAPPSVFPARIASIDNHFQVK